MSLVSYSFTQPYFKYVENAEYNVIPGNITLTFDSAASTDPGDYRIYVFGGIYDAPFESSFYVIYPNPTISFSGNSAVLTMPITLGNNSYTYFYYQGIQLDIMLRANTDSTFETPAIYEMLPLLL